MNKEKDIVSEGEYDRERLRAILIDLANEDLYESSSELLINVIEADTVAAGEDLSWFMAYDLDPGVADTAFTFAFLCLKADYLSEDSECELKECMGPLLLKSLKNKVVSDDRKYKIGPLCAFCMGPHIMGQEYEGYFDDFDAVRNRMATESADSISDTPESVEEMLQSIDMLIENDMPIESRYSAVAFTALDVADVVPSATAAILAANLVIECADPDSDVNLDDAVAMIEELECPKAAWFLNEMGRWPGMGALSEKAERAARKMQLKGIKPENDFTAEFSHALLTAPDGMGSRQLSLFFASDNGDLDIISILYNDLAGMKDVWASFGNGREIEEQYLNAPGDMPITKCSFKLVEEMLADMWAFHEDTNTPFPPYLFVYRPFFGEKPIDPKRRKPKLHAYKLGTIRKGDGKELVKESAILANSTVYSLFSLCGTEAYKYVADIPEEDWDEKEEEVVDDFLNTVESTEKELLLSRMAETLEVESLARRNKNSINKIAASTWVAIKDGTLPFEAIPYVRELGWLSIDMIQDNLLLGYQNQADADKAAIEMGGVLNEYLENMMDDE